MFGYKVEKPAHYSGIDLKRISEPEARLD